MNKLTVSVAGSRKTQGIVDACENASPQRRILIIAFTQTNQAELERRIEEAGHLNPHIEILGWYAFLLRHFVRPYLGLLYPGRTLEGFNFEGHPGRYAKDAARFLDNQDRAYQVNLAALAHKVHRASGGSVVDRLESIYTHVYVDEAQDISGWSLEILDVLFQSQLHVNLVGDMRQSLLSTDPTSQKNSRYRAEKVLDWYKEREKQGSLIISENSTTYRSNQEIASFSDQIFDPALGYAPTVSANEAGDPHEGIFRVAPEHVEKYVQAYSPLALHLRRDLGKNLPVSFLTFGRSKGMTVKHVLILPTKKFVEFLQDGEKKLEGKTACAFYVGVTRALHSVAFVLEPKVSAPHLTDWQPADMETSGHR